MIWEVETKGEVEENEKMRFIQPAERFYTMCLKLWMLEKSSTN